MIREKAVMVGLAYSAIALLWGPLSPARATDALAPLSEQPSTYQEPAVPKYRLPMQGRSARNPDLNPAYEKPVVLKYKPPTHRRSFANPPLTSVPRPPDNAVRGTAGTAQTEKVMAPSQRVAPVADPIKTGSPTIVGRVLFRGVIPPPTHIDIDRELKSVGRSSIFNRSPSIRLRAGFAMRLCIWRSRWERQQQRYPMQDKKRWCRSKTRIVPSCRRWG